MTPIRYFLLCVLSLFTISALLAQSEPGASAALIKLKLNKLNVLSAVLYMAAHPDDENTRIITYLANDELATTAYLSMTRGDGGQNLIGAELRDQLGLIRTQELLAARRIDGGHQFFSRANDFGFSKSATETFQIWGKQEVSEDVVRVLRQFKPDVIITRFPPDERAGHGHHTASAVLAQEAFDLASDPAAFPATAQEFGVWQVKRLYTNTGRWWNNTINENTPGVITLDVGGYSTLLGKSFTELAALSRSQHKSQGFGSAGTRGRQVEFLEFIKGEQAQKNIFEGINTTWTRVKGGDKVKPLVEKVIREFNMEHPERSVPQLLLIRQQIQLIEDGIWKTRKLAETEQLIQDCLGLFAEATALHYYASPGHPVSSMLEIINRSSVPVDVVSVTAPALSYDSSIAFALKENIPLQVKVNKVLPGSTYYSDPYWLQQPHQDGLFQVTNKELIGRPEADAAVMFQVRVKVNGQPLELTVPLRYKWTDPAKGELYRPMEVVPLVAVNLAESSMVFPDGQPRIVEVRVQSTNAANVSGTLQLMLPEGWVSSPETFNFTFAKTGAESVCRFSVTPAAREGVFAIRAVARIDKEPLPFERSLKNISYDHFPIQTLLPPASFQAVRINIKKQGETIAYIKGAGDDVPAALRSMGYTVIEMKDDEVTLANLKNADAVVLGIRAVNTNERMDMIMPVLLAYTQAGGTLVVQYNTNFDLETDQFAPYPLTISRERVTQQDAEVRLLKSDHPVLNFPNKITTYDFDGWVQERGLYFPNKWDTQYEAILSMNDAGEPARDGSLLIARYGAGYYVYTGLSFFRQLPEGVPGAYKLFVNLVSLRGQPVSAAADKPDAEHKKSKRARKE